jgi:hypothetical protein
VRERTERRADGQNRCHYASPTEQLSADVTSTIVLTSLTVGSASTLPGCTMITSYAATQTRYDG